MEQIGDCTLYLADCRDVLPDIKADVLISDPVWPNCPKDLLQGADDPYGLMKSVFDCVSVKRAVVVMRHDSDPRFLTALPDTLPFFRLQILPYVMPGYIGRKLGGDEIAYVFGEPIKSAPNRRVVPGYAPKVQPDGRKANGHPCSRATAHFDWLVYWNSDIEESIVDPFMGSGTTGVACARTGRKFTGIEIEEKYFEIACRRIEEAYSQGRLLA